MEEIIKNLKLLKEAAESALIGDVFIRDIVYRPFDMGVFGSKGYAVIFGVRSNWAYGIRFATLPAKDVLESQLKEQIKKLWSKHG